MIEVDLSSIWLCVTADRYAFLCCLLLALHLPVWSRHYGTTMLPKPPLYSQNERFRLNVFCLLSAPRAGLLFVVDAKLYLSINEHLQFVLYTFPLLYSPSRLKMMVAE